MFNPWMESTRRGIRIFAADLWGRSACTDGQRVWLDQHLTCAEARCSLTHELVHIVRGHCCNQNACIEATVRDRVARLLTPMSVILARAQSQENPADIAEELGITLDVLADRMCNLTRSERAQLRAATFPYVTA